MSVVSNIKSPLFYKKKDDLNIIIRDIKKGDGEDIVKLFEANYGFTYYKKNFYNQKTWEDMINSDFYYSVVAEFNGKIVGEFLLHLNDKYNGEILAVVVHPEFKGRGIMNKMFDYLIQKAKDLGLYAIYGEAIMFHSFSQKANLKHGMTETALQLGEVASFIAQKEIKFEKRTGTLVSYFIFKKDTKQIFLPKIYKKIIKGVYKKAGIKIVKSKKNNLKPVIKLWKNRLLKIGGVIIEGKVQNFEKRFALLFSKLKSSSDMIYADINLQTKEIDNIVEFLNKNRFFYSGVLFYRYKKNDYLRLQFENRHKIEEKYNVCYSEYCKFLSKFVLKDKKRVNHL